MKLLVALAPSSGRAARAGWARRITTYLEAQARRTPQERTTRPAPSAVVTASVGDCGR